MPSKPKPKEPPALTHIKDLKPDPANARKHNPRNIGLIADAMQAVGVARSIVIDEDDVILAGNGAVDAAAQAGITKLHVVEADGDTMIAVRRRGLTPEQKVRLALSDNRAAELAEWDIEVLKQLQADGVDLSAHWYPNELAQLFPDPPADAAEHWQGMPEFDQKDEMPFKRLVINFRNQADYEEFSRVINQTLTDRTMFVWHPAAPRQPRSSSAYVDET